MLAHFSFRYHYLSFLVKSGDLLDGLDLLRWVKINVASTKNGNEVIPVFESVALFANEVYPG